MPAELTPQVLTIYLLIGAGVVSLLMAILNVGNVMRAAGLICLAVAIATVALIVQGQENRILVYIAGFALLGAISLIGGFFGGTEGKAVGRDAGEHH